MTEKQAGGHAEDMAAAMLAATLDIDFDEKTSWDEKKKCTGPAIKFIK